MMISEHDDDDDDDDDGDDDDDKDGDDRWTSAHMWKPYGCISLLNICSM